MSKDEKRKILSEHLTKFRSRSYAQLEWRVEPDRQAHSIDSTGFGNPEKSSREVRTLGDGHSRLCVNSCLFF